MNVLFSGGDNWYPAIIGSKAVNKNTRYCDMHGIVTTRVQGGTAIRP